MFQKSHNIEKKMKETLLMLIMFWNLENYFDPFPPNQIKFWSWNKFEKKRDNIAKLIILTKEEYNSFPAIIGVCEVENYFVLHQLTSNTPLARLGYEIIHKDSPDKRGIDVALLYQKEHYTPIYSKFIPILLNTNKRDTIDTRLILYSKGIVNNMDTLHIFVNHWPSKLGGEKVSGKKRMLASNTVKRVTDSILRANNSANIILMGDFNDTPQSDAITNLNRFVNLAHTYTLHHKNCGTHKYKATWSVIDQFIVSKGLYLNNNESLENNYSKWIYCKENSMSIFKSAHLLVRDYNYMGYKVKRTMQGSKYLGGISDHLPIVLKVFKKEL